MTEIYTDELYINHHHKNENENLYHPETNDEDQRPKYKGKRLFFVAAIGGHGYSEFSGLVSASVWIFAPSSTKGHVGHYHNVFKSESYV